MPVEFIDVKGFPFWCIFSIKYLLQFALTTKWSMWQIWSMNHNSFVRDLRSHKRVLDLEFSFFGFSCFFFLKFLNFTGNISNYLQEVYCIEWSPTGPTTDNPNLTLLLARWICHFFDKVIFIIVKAGTDATYNSH